MTHFTRAVLPLFGWTALFVAGGSACSARHAREAAEPLDGLEVPLRMAAGVRAEVDGLVGDVPASVVLDVAQPISGVSTGCFGPELPKTTTFVRYPEPGGGWQEAPQIALPPSRLGARRVGGRDVALYEDDGRCVLVLGNDFLAPYALEVDPATRTLRILRSRTRAEWVTEAADEGARGSGIEQHLLELTRDPQTDWPLLAARLWQGDAKLVGTFVLSTGQPDTLVSQKAAREVGLQPGPDFIRELGVPEDLTLPRTLGGNAFSLDRLELTPGFGVRFASAEGVEQWEGQGVLGVIGGDVWGRFHTVIDAGAGVLVLRRPRLFASGTRQRCARPDGAPNEEACFVLHQRDTDEGVQFVVTMWRELPRGGRVYLDVLDAKGESTSATCRVGMSFARSDRGVSAAHPLPWDGLTRAMPGCAEGLGAAARVRFSLWEEEPLDACPGTCAFVQDVLTHRVSCACQGGALAAMGDAEQRFLEMYKGILERRGEEGDEEEDPHGDEPEDP